MKYFNANRVKPSSHLVPADLRDRAHSKRVYKQALEWADGKKPKVKSYLAPVRAGFVPRGFGRRNDKLVGLSNEKREVINAKRASRAAFFAEMGVQV